MDHGTKHGDCDSCGYTTELRSFRAMESFEAGTDRFHWYCALCSGSVTASISRHTGRDARILETICYVGNAILAPGKYIADTGDGFQMWMSFGLSCS